MVIRVRLSQSTVRKRLELLELSIGINLVRNLVGIEVRLSQSTVRKRLELLEHSVGINLVRNLVGIEVHLSQSTVRKQLECLHSYGIDFSQHASQHNQMDFLLGKPCVHDSELIDSTQLQHHALVTHMSGHLHEICSPTPR